MNKIGFFIGLIALSTQIAHAQTVDISLGEDHARFELGQTTTAKGMGHAQRTFGLRYNENNDAFLNMGFEVLSGARQFTLVEAGAGARVHLGTIEIGVTDIEMAAIAIGGHVNYMPFVQNRLGFGLEGAYAPPIVTFGDAERYVEWQLTVRFRAMTTAEVYAGVRNTEITSEITGAKVDFEDGAFIGLRLGF